MASPSSMRCSSTSPASKPRTWTRSSGCSCRNRGRRWKMPAMSVRRSPGGAAACMPATTAATTTWWRPVVRLRPRPSGARRRRWSRPASPTTSTCRDRRSRSTPRVRVRSWRCIWRARRCAPVKWIWPWPAACSCSARRVCTWAASAPGCSPRTAAATPSTTGPTALCRAKASVRSCSSGWTRRWPTGITCTG